MTNEYDGSRYKEKYFLHEIISILTTDVNDDLKPQSVSTKRTICTVVLIKTQNKLSKLFSYIQ